MAAPHTAAGITASEKDPRGIIERISDDLRLLRKAPRELWMIFMVKFLESVAYFAIYNLINVFLSEDLGMTDIEAGVWSGNWLLAISIVTFFSGFIADSMGIRNAIVISIISCTLGRCMISFSSERWVVLAGLFVMTWGVASMMPTMTAAVRKYTNKNSVSLAFSLFYVIMNMGAFVAPRLISYYRKQFADGQTLELPVLGAWQFTSSQSVFLIGFSVTVLSLLITLFGIRRDDVVERYLQTNNLVEESKTDAEKKRNPIDIFMEVIRESAFWRFILFVSLLVLVRLIFQHAHLTWPKYTMREFGKDFDWASYWSINPLMIIFITPFVTAATKKLSAFYCIVIGSIISGLSVFAMAISTSIEASIFFIVILSLGEALWSPRLYEYMAVIAPKGREGSYMGMSQLPMFLAKPVVGFLSGALLTQYCPVEGERNSQIMWLIVGVTTLLGPVLILALRSVIQGQKATVEAV